MYCIAVRVAESRSDRLAGEGGFLGRNLKSLRCNLDSAGAAPHPPRALPAHQPNVLGNFLCTMYSYISRFCGSMSSILYLLL